MNSDVKLFAKVLALRMEPFMGKLVHPDQTGSIKSRLSADNVRRLLHIIHGAPEIKSPCAVLSLDAAQAFDRIEWHYVWTVLEKMGFGPLFIAMFKTLYESSHAQIMTGNVCSSPFALGRSSRQGCVTSALIFALAMEPLAQAIRQCRFPICILGTEHYISLYVDDILIYLQSANKATPMILDIFDEFGCISGYKIN